VIDMKQAVQIARQSAADILGKTETSLEELSRDHFQDRDVWSITLSFPRDPKSVPPTESILGKGFFQYKKFLIDVETGELLAMLVRDFAFQ
jgi:chorismate mutase